jgi:hypothetical protein
MGEENLKEEGLGESDAGSRWKQSPLELLRGSSELRFGVI